MTNPTPSTDADELTFELVNVIPTSIEALCPGQSLSLMPSSTGVNVSTVASGRRVGQLSEDDEARWTKTRRPFCVVYESGTSPTPFCRVRTTRRAIPTAPEAYATPPEEGPTLGKSEEPPTSLDEPVLYNRPKDV